MPSSIWLLGGGLAALALFLVYKRLDKAWLLKAWTKIIRADTRSAIDAETAKANDKARAEAADIAEQARKENLKLSIREKLRKLRGR